MGWWGVCSIFSFFSERLQQQELQVQQIGDKEPTKLMHNVMKTRISVSSFTINDDTQKINLGDVVDLTNWSSLIYECKLIRKPAFIKSYDEALILEQQEIQKQRIQAIIVNNNYKNTNNINNYLPRRSQSLGHSSSLRLLLLPPPRRTSHAIHI